MFKFAAVCALVVVQTTLAQAAQPPKFDVKATCRQAQPLMGDQTDQGIYQSCVNEENGARSQLKSSWSTYKASTRKSCVDEAQIGGAPSYVDLLTCLQLYQDATTLPQ